MPSDRGPARSCFVRVKLSADWLFIFAAISCVCKKKINPNPSMEIFGVPSEEVKLSANQMKVVALVILLARKLVLANWKSHNVSTRKHWLKEVMANL